MTPTTSSLVMKEHESASTSGTLHPTLHRAPKFDLKTLDGIKKFDGFLQGRSYVGGTKPSADDVAMFKELGFNPDFMHVVRWFNHINSFSDAERVAWGGAAAAAPKKEEKKKPAADDDFDLFGGDDEEDAKVLEEKKAKDAEVKKPQEKEAARSQLIWDVKGWDAEQDMKALEEAVRNVSMNGLVWSNTAKYVDVAYGIKKLQIGCTVVDDLVSTDELEELLMAIGVTDEDEDGWVQSCEIVAFIKM